MLKRVLAAGLVACSLLTTPAFAQDAFPTKPVGRTASTAAVITAAPSAGEAIAISDSPAPTPLALAVSNSMPTNSTG